jgi:hypothetical protein
MNKLFFIYFTMCCALIAHHNEETSPPHDYIGEITSLLDQQPELRSFHDQLSPEEKEEFTVIIKEVNIIINTILLDLTTVAKNHQSLIEKFKEFLGEEQYIVTLNFSKSPLNENNQ